MKVSYSLCFHGNSTSGTIEHLPHNCFFVQSSEIRWFTNLCVRKEEEGEERGLT